MDPSGVEVKKGIKNEIIELFDVSIQNKIKSVVEFKVKKEIIDESEVIDKLDLSIKNEIQEGIDLTLKPRKKCQCLKVIQLMKRVWEAIS